MLGSLSLFMYLWETLTNILEQAAGDAWNKKVQRFPCVFFLCVGYVFFSWFYFVCQLLETMRRLGKAAKILMLIVAK